MKSEVKTSFPETKELKFPLLARSKVNQTIVLFTDIGTGTVVASNENWSDENLGKYSNTWIDCNNANNWEILPAGSTITLTQE